MSLLSVIFLIWNVLIHTEWSDLDDTEDIVNNELLSLSKPWSREGKGNLGNWGLQSLHRLLHLWPLDGLAR